MHGLVVVPGVNGHIGNNLARQLIEEGYKVRGTVRSMDKALNLDMEFVVADVLNSNDWPKALKGATGLFHLATVYATSGDEGSVRIWSCLLKRCVMRASPDTFGGSLLQAKTYWPLSATKFKMKLWIS